MDRDLVVLLQRYTFGGGDVGRLPRGFRTPNFRVEVKIGGQIGRSGGERFGDREVVFWNRVKEFAGVAGGYGGLGRPVQDEVTRGRRGRGGK